jgi:hypothetical protein
MAAGWRVQSQTERSTVLRTIYKAKLPLSTSGGPKPENLIKKVQK